MGKIQLCRITGTGPTPKNGPWLEHRHWYLQLFDVDDGWGDEQRELPDPCHALGVVRGVEADRRLHPLVVWRRLWGRCGRCHLSA
jgi:hypothetical protein